MQRDTAQKNEKMFPIPNKEQILMFQNSTYYSLLCFLLLGSFIY